MEQRNDKRLPSIPSLGGEKTEQPPSVLVIQEVGAVVIAFAIAEHDPFIDNLPNIPYPDDAP